jgi:hypothetical protein
MKPSNANIQRPIQIEEAESYIEFNILHADIPYSILSKDIDAIVSTQIQYNLIVLDDISVSSIIYILKSYYYQQKYKYIHIFQYLNII